MKVAIDPELCVGCGLCASNCPEVFRMEGDKAVVCVGIVPLGQEELARQTTSDCPVEAIKIS